MKSGSVLLRMGLALGLCFGIGCASKEVAMTKHADSGKRQQPHALKKTLCQVVESRYLLYLPAEYESQPEKRWPLILFLHGAGERGSNLDQVRNQGLAKQLEQDASFPFIVVSPQCPAERWWPGEIGTLLALLDDIESTYRVDTHRVYVTGLSMGGFGTWALAAAYPERFAAIAPICGKGEPYTAFRLKDTPTWVFHGAKDTVVPLRHSEEMVEALKNHGADVTFTVYPEAEHDSWTQTYTNPELYAWFLKHSK